MPSKKPKRKPSQKPKSSVKGRASDEFGGDIFNGDDLTAMRRKLRGRDFEITDLRKIHFEGEDGKTGDENWYLFTDAFDQGFKVIKKAGRRLGQAFGDDMNDWIGRKVEIQVVEYGVGVGPDIFPADDAESDRNDDDDESID